MMIETLPATAPVYRVIEAYAKHQRMPELLKVEHSGKWHNKESTWFRVTFKSYYFRTIKKSTCYEDSVFIQEEGDMFFFFVAKKGRRSRKVKGYCSIARLSNKEKICA